nr:hypothetical protein [Tanacetum cinerariifolium]
MHKAFPLSVMEFSLPEEVSTASTTSDGTDKKKGMTVTVTFDDMQKRKNDVKARTTLLLSLPNEHQLRFTKHSRGNEDVNTANVSTASTNVSTASANIGVVTISQDNACAYIASQSSGLQEARTEEGEITTDNGLKLKNRLQKCRWQLMEWDGTRVIWRMMKRIMHYKITDLTDRLFDAKNMIYHYKLRLAQVECRLAEHIDRELKYCEKIRGLEFKTESSDDYIESLKKELELIKKEKEGLDSKLTGFQTASKDLDTLLESQRLDKNKEGLGYSAVLPPPTQIYSPPKKDMSWTGLPEFKDDIVTDYSRPAPTVESFPDDAQNRNPFVTETEASPSTISPKSFIKFVKENDNPTNSKTDKAETAKKPHVKYVEQYRKPTKKPNVRGNQRNWNNLKSHQL